VKGHTLNVAGYVQDSWQLRPNLTLNAGIRYEEQRLRNAEHLIGTRAQGTGQLLGKNALVLRNMWAPRVGVIYDWSEEGRSKLYGSWGRYYESVPLNLNDRSFGAESGLTTTYDAASCGAPNENLGGAVDGVGCLSGDVTPSSELLNGSGVLVASGVSAQYLDETILGVEYELLEGLKIGLSYQNRRLGRVLEDLSTDNAQTYILANPGEWSAEEERKLVGRVDRETDPVEKARLQSELSQFQGIRNFDRARRDYNSLSATVSKRFSNKLFVQSSYTYSRTEGNYQGLFSSTNGQVDPNITSLFDLPELMANREGALPQDRPHSFKFDGFYNFDLGRPGVITTGVSLRAASGAPVNATGAHYSYGQNETALLPRGSMGRIELSYDASIHLGYKRNIGGGMKLEGFLDFFNLNAIEAFGGQRTASVDETYTFSSVNPVVGGKYEDLIYLKELDQSSGAETTAPITALRNRNFGQARSLTSPPGAQIGARLTF
ncbi:MAG: TonB-dependent receptor, partial [Kofleriaceae bacterium]|nr:TonB-dependent receptor [Kofleriaceae bacterium]